MHVGFNFEDQYWLVCSCISQQVREVQKMSWTLLKSNTMVHISEGNAHLIKE